uniref:Uncharacterized protein n=1 Tax=Cacopsylla melanoneura TaxID=428564 RepID=A0A8D8UG14_9HEMI
MNLKCLFTFGSAEMNLKCLFTFGSAEFNLNSLFIFGSAEINLKSLFTFGSAGMNLKCLFTFGSALSSQVITCFSFSVAMFPCGPTATLLALSHSSRSSMNPSRSIRSLTCSLISSSCLM